MLKQYHTPEARVASRKSLLTFILANPPCACISYITINKLSKHEFMVFVVGIQEIMLNNI